MPPVQHPQEPDDPQAGSVVDPRVVAERRAHRAELSEAALRERVVDAEHRLVEAQRLLGGAYDQRKDLAGRLKQAERDLRAARQGEHAEAQRRVELEEDAGVARRQAEQEITALRAALVASEQRVRELEQELDRVQRTAAELQQAVATAQVQGGPTATAPDGARDAAAAQLAARLEEVRVVEERLAAGRDELARRRGGLETRLHDTGVVAGSLEERIVAEREARLHAVHELENERERASAEVTLLQHELDRRMQVQEAVSQQLVELRAELAQTQARVASDAERRALAESVLTELGTTALQLRDELQSLEDERRDVERQLAAARAQVAERDTRLEEQAAYLTAADAALTALRVELDEAATALRTTSGDTTHQQERLDAAERAVTQAEAQSLHLAQQLESERRERARTEQELRTRIAEERDAFQNTVEQHRLATERAIALERAAFEAHVTTVRDGVVALRERLAGVEADVEARLQQERDARLAAEQRLEAERHGRAVALTELQAERTTAAKSGADRERREAETQALRGRLAEVEQELTAARTLVAVERGRVDDATAAAQAAARADVDAACARAEAAEAHALTVEQRAQAAESRAHTAEQERDRLLEEILVVRDESDAAQSEARDAVARAHAAVVEAQDASEAAIAATRAHVARSSASAVARAERAEAERDRLQADLDAREPADDVQASLARLRSELVHVRAETAERAEREAQLESLVTQLIASASSLEDGFARELAATAAERDLQVAAERERFSAQLADMEQRVTQMREQVSAAASELSRQLLAERDARRAAEEQLRTMRELSFAAAADAVDPAEVGHLQRLLTLEQQTAARAEDRIVELEDELERVRVALRPPPPMPPADHPALREASSVQPSGSGDPDSVIIDLARAAARLRIRREEALGDEPATVQSSDAGVDRPDDTPSSTVQATSPAPDARQAAVVPEGPAVPPAAVPPSAGPHTEVEIGARAEIGGPRNARSWLTPALAALAGRDPQAAASTLQALIPVQAARLQQNLTYDLCMEDHAPLRVRLHQDGTCDVTLRTAEQQDDAADFRLAGPAVALAPFLGGGTARRPPAGAVVTGRRRRARKLLRALRRPVTLGTLAAADVELSSVELLSLLMGAIDPQATAGEHFTVAFAHTAGPVHAHVVVADAEPIDVRPGAPAHAAATVRTGPGTLAAFLAGVAAARVSGEVDVVGRLLAWADAAQGLDA